jgi:hypothetical protein
MATIDTLQDAVNTLTSSTTELLDEVQVNKSTLETSATNAATSATNAASSASNASTSASSASTSATAASASATAAANSASSANAIVTGVASGRPSVRPSFIADFANSKTLDPRINHSRSTIATYWDGHSSTMADHNMWRNGTYIDPTNSGWGSTGSTYEINSVAAPDGSITATYLKESNALGTHSAFYSDADMTLNPLSYLNNADQYANYATASVYAKAGERDKITLSVAKDINEWVSIKYDLTNGTILQTQSQGETLPTGTIVDVGDGWYRCTLTMSTRFGQAWMMIGLSDNANAIPNDEYGRDVYQGITDDGAYFWGGQFEFNPEVTAHIPASNTYPDYRTIPVIQTAAINEPVFDHEPATKESLGLRIYPDSTTNLVEYGVTGSGKSNTRIKETSKLRVPDGSIQQAVIVPDTTNQTHYVRDTQLPVTAGSNYTVSVFAKAVHPDYFPRLRLRVIAGASDNTLYVDLLNGTKTNEGELDSYEIQEIGGGWYRCGFTFEAAETTNASIYTYVAQSDNNSVFAGDGIHGLAVWGWQFENSNRMTPYIHTEGSTVTRTGDITYMDNDLFDSDEKSMYVDASLYASTSGIVAMLVSNTNNQNRIMFNYYYGYQALHESMDKGYIEHDISGFDPQEAESEGSRRKFYKAATSLSADLGVTSIAELGYKQTTPIRNVPMGLSRLVLGCNHTLSYSYPYLIKKVAVYPTALSINECVALTEG